MRSADSEWRRLKGNRGGLERRWEKYAAFTLPRLYTGDFWNEDSDELTHDWHSVGAQAVNHIVSKLMLTLFAPSRPFMRLQATEEFMASLPDGFEEGQIEEALSLAENAAAKKLDQIPYARPKLYNVVAALVVLGNCLMYLPEEKNKPLRAYTPQNYVVRRTGTGDIKTLIVMESLRFDELQPNVQQGVIAAGGNYRDDTEVSHYRHFELKPTGGYIMVQSVNTTILPREFNGAWANDETLPWRVLTFNRADSNNYGSGLVEDYAGDFASLSTLTQAEVQGAVLASEFRWLVSPGGQTNPEDIQNSPNGAAIPGMPGEVELLSNSKPGDLQVVQQSASGFVNRIGRGFLLNSAVTRDAERVTAEEIRLQAQELETGLGGVYSHLASGMQLPLARWLLKNVDLTVKGHELDLSIVTGLDALSRSGDLDALRAVLADLANVGIVKEAVPELRTRAVAEAIFQGHGLPTNKYMLSPEELQAEQEQQMAMMAAQQAAMGAGEAAGEATAQ